MNYDLTAYLPQDMPTTKALTLMDDTFGYTGMAQVMLEDMSIDEILEMKAQIAAVDGVSMVMWLDDVADVRAPLSTLDASVVQSYYNDGAALLTVQFADSDYSERTRAAVQEIDRLTGDNAMTGSAVTAGLLIQSSAEEVLLVVLWAIPVVLIILLFATASIAEALIFLFVLGVSVLINMGTNAFLPSISFFSQLSVAVLQMAIAMDYSIFLLSRFREERANGTDPVVAMTAAVKKAFLSISASSTTTIAGFVALMFMRYTIGWDMGLVLAKGIVFSLLSVLFGDARPRADLDEGHRPHEPPSAFAQGGRLRARREQVPLGSADRVRAGGGALLHRAGTKPLCVWRKRDYGQRRFRAGRG